MFYTVSYVIILLFHDIMNLNTKSKILSFFKQSVCVTIFSELTVVFRILCNFKFHIKYVSKVYIIVSMLNVDHLISSKISNFLI